jgi:phospholipid/cholesterol/gamma-HCH transport system ATP-binding protein
MRSKAVVAAGSRPGSDALTGDGKTPAIELRGLFKSFEGTRVLRGLDLAIRPGESITIIGGSGSGKSVLLRLIIGLLKPEAGQILLEGQDIVSLRERELLRVRRKVGMVFQGSALFDSLSVGENVGYALREHTTWDEERIRSRVREALDLVGLEAIEAMQPAELSGGMRKRVGLARALAMEPELMLYDEPTTGLDPIMGDVINELILSTRRRHPVTSIIVTHDMRTAQKVADRVVMLYPTSRLRPGEAQVLFDGPPAQLATAPDPRVRQFLEGKAGERIMELQRPNGS